MDSYGLATAWQLLASNSTQNRRLSYLIGFKKIEYFTLAEGSQPSQSPIIIMTECSSISSVFYDYSKASSVQLLI